MLVYSSGRVMVRSAAASGRGYLVRYLMTMAWYSVKPFCWRRRTSWKALDLPYLAPSFPPAKISWRRASTTGSVALVAKKSRRPLRGKKVLAVGSTHLVENSGSFSCAGVKEAGGG